MNAASVRGTRRTRRSGLSVVMAGAYPSAGSPKQRARHRFPTTIHGKREVSCLFARVRPRPRPIPFGAGAHGVALRRQRALFAHPARPRHDDAPW